ncbi:serine/threonine-protein kinase [Kitasatospora sp. NPDC004289]
MRAGDLIGGRYRLHEMLGRGNQGHVARATNELTGAPVAVKLQAPRTFESTDDYRYFGGELEREYDVGKALTGIEGVPRTHWQGEHHGARYLVMDLVDGVTLAHLVKQSAPFSRDVMAAVLDQLCATVAELHRRGYVHRDIKPDNVMVCPNGRVLLIDVGIAVLSGHCDYPRGTAGYAAPEQYLATTLTGQADVFALGCVLLKMGTLDLPYGDTLDERPNRGTHQYPEGFRTSMNEELYTLGLAMTAWDPAERPNGAALVREYLQPLLPRRGEPANPKAPKPDPTAWYRD